MPAIPDTFPAFGPAALMIVPASMAVPSPSVTPVTRDPVRPMARTSPAIRSIRFDFSALRSRPSNACASNQPAGSAIGAGGDAFRRDPGETANQRVRTSSRDVRAFGHL